MPQSIASIIRQARATFNVPQGALIRDAMYWIDQTIAIGAIPAETKHFATKQATAVTGNLPKDGEVQYPIMIQSFGLEMFATLSDWQIVNYHSKFQWQVGEVLWREYPATHVVGFAGPYGFNQVVASDQAQSGMGLGKGTELTMAIPINPGTTFSLNQISDGTAVVAAVIQRVWFKGIEFVPPLQ